MLRVAMISPLPPMSSGESTYTRDLIESLSKSGKVRIIAIGQKDALLMEEKIPNVETHPVWDNNKLFYPLSLWRYIRKLNVDLVHVQFGPHGRVYGGMFGERMIFLLLLLRLSGIPTTITLHSTWMPNQVEKRIREFYGRKWFAKFAPTLFRLYTRLLAWGSSSIQLGTVKLDSLLRSRFLKEYNLPQERILEIPHGCKKTEEIPQRELAVEKLGLRGRKVILVFGFIRKEKGIEVAIEAMKKVSRDIPDSILLIAGSPKDAHGRKYLQELKMYTKANGLQEYVRFVPEYIEDDMVPYYYGASSILLAPYTESVGASGPIHNSAGYGIPIIASDVGLHMRESIGGNLVLFKNLDSKDLAEKICQVLKNENTPTEIHDRQIEYTNRETWELAAQRTLENYWKTFRLEDFLRKKKSIVVITGAGAFKKGHYSRVQALLEYLARRKQSNSWFSDYDLVLLVENPTDSEEWAFDSSFPETFEVQHYGWRVKEGSRGKVILKGLSTLTGLNSIKERRHTISISSMIQGGFFGALSKRLGKIGFFIYDDMDYYPGFLENRILKTMVGQVEKQIVRSADYVSSVSPSLSKLRKKQGAKCIGICPNGADPYLFEESFSINSSKETDEFVLVYSGSLDPEIWGIDIVLDAVSNLCKKMNILLKVIGGGPHLNKMVELAARLDISHCVEFTGPVDHSNLADLFKGVHVGLAVGIPGSPAEDADPIKLKEYVVAGIPFIGTDLPAIRQLAEETNFGVLCKPNSQSVAEAILQMRANRKRMIQNAVSARNHIIENYSWDAVFDALFKHALNLKVNQEVENHI